MKKKLPKPYKLPSGSWRCIVTIDGVRHSVIGETKEEAQAKAVATRAGLIESQSKRREFFSLGDAIDDYIEKNDGILAPSSLRGYSIIRRNRFRSLMDANIYAITADDIQEAIVGDLKSASPKTVKSAADLVLTVLKKNGIIISGVKKPKVVKPKKDYMQPEELESFFEAAAEDSHGPAIIITVWSGMRRSEVCGLCWDCVDFKTGTITIRRKVTPDRNNKMTLQVGTKTEASQRTIHCPDYIMDIFYRLRPINPRPDQRVFPIHPDTLRKAVHRVCRKAGVTDSSAHGLRHTNAAAMRFLGIEIHHAMERGGWSNEETFNKTYAYNFKSAMSEANRKVDTFFKDIADQAITPTSNVNTTKTEK